MTLLTIYFFIKYSLNLPFSSALGASKSPCAATYCGSAPESEKETKALADFIRENLSTIKAYLTIHSYSQLLLFPYSYTYNLPSNYQELVSLCHFDLMKRIIKNHHLLFGPFNFKPFL